MFYSANGNGHYASQPMQQQQQQSPYMGINNLPGNGYNKGQYMQRAPIYDGNLCMKIDDFLDENSNILNKLLETGNIPQHQSLDLAGSREQRGSAFELYRKPQLGNMPIHHHNVR